MKLFESFETKLIRQHTLDGMCSTMFINIKGTTPADADRITTPEIVILKIKLSKCQPLTLSSKSISNLRRQLGPIQMAAHRHRLIGGNSTMQM